MVWVLRTPRGKGITKLAHQWVGQAKVVQDAGFDNMEVVRGDIGEHLVTHSSFLVASSCPSDSLGAIAERILAELEEEDDEAETGSRGDGRAANAAPLGPGARAQTTECQV
ncbi:RNA-dependent DNA polymerase [Phytophthora cinnamomi]|uniref:RNA-dependent DNA polymerase n=1 Tax=Phytophthora cinnamomi TaxID=4785 RepID=UPI003559BE5C|nr:RNA-dependent DNA polymerase [Phytophthora cinnamomi]